MIPIRITVQGCDVSQTLRDRAQAQAVRWPRFDPAVMDATLVFRQEGRGYTVEAVVARRRRQVAVAQGQGSDFRSALDRLDQHMSRILRRDRTRRKDFRSS